MYVSYISTMPKIASIHLLTLSRVSTLACAMQCDMIPQPALQLLCGYAFARNNDGINCIQPHSQIQMTMLKNVPVKAENSDLQWLQ
jgi:hypothetical protein